MRGACISNTSQGSTIVQLELFLLAVHCAYCGKANYEPVYVVKHMGTITMQYAFCNQDHADHYYTERQQDMREAGLWLPNGTHTTFVRIAMLCVQSLKSSFATTSPSVVITQPARRSSMLKLALVLCLSLWATTTRAEPPPVPEGGLTFFLEQPCRDQESGQKGYCYMGKSQDGTVYMTFWQNGELMLIREVTGDTYITIWASDKFNSI